jgi:hypothetical protein
MIGRAKLLAKGLTLVFAMGLTLFYARLGASLEEFLITTVLNNARPRLWILARSTSLTIAAMVVRELSPVVKLVARKNSH